MSQGQVTINRTLVGIVSVVCLSVSIGLWYSGANEADDSFVMGAGAGAAFFRVGLLMGAFWLALPSKSRDAAWAQVNFGTLIGLLLAIFAIAAKPKVAIPFLLALGVMALFLKPRNKRRPPRP